MPKSVDAELRRREFVEASADLVATEGLGAATMRRVAERAGCTTGSLTHYFANRDELLIATLRHVHTSASTRMERALDDEIDPVVRLERVLIEALPMTRSSLVEWRVWLAFWSVAMDDAALTDENARRYREWRTLVERLLGPFVSPSALDIEAVSLVALIDGLGVAVAREFPNRRRLAHRRRDARQALDRYVAALI